jgi:transcriptional regulator with XRE-family HTH domain
MKDFIEELRLAREAAGFTQEQLATEINYSQGQISKIETGERPPSKDFADRADIVLNTGGLLGRIVRRAQQQQTTPAWFRSWPAVEGEATSLRAYHPVLIPGLLQTEAYARALLSADPGVTPDEVEQRVSARLERRLGPSQGSTR